MKEKFTISKIIVITAILSITLSSLYTSAEKKVLMIDTEASCITSSCHENMGKKKYIHQAGIDPLHCNRCHEIVREGEHTFKPLPSETRLLCAQCHSKDAKPPKDIKGIPPKVIFEDKEAKFHPLFAQGRCTECHDPHESNFYRHLKASYPEELYAPYSDALYTLCVNTKCHKGFEEALKEPRTLTATMFRNGNLNLHFRHVNKKKGRTCRTCHQICYQRHGPKNPKLIKETLQFGKKKLEIRYKKTETGGECYSPCHRVAKYDRYEPVFNLIKTTPRPGRDATEEELRLSKERDMQKEKTIIEEKEEK
jgi:predicted CXXCH cytochrome family protein